MAETPRKENEVRHPSLNRGRVPEGVLPMPKVTDVKEWFAAMDRIGGDPLFKGGRKQPPRPRRKIFD